MILKSTLFTLVLFLSLPDLVFCKTKTSRRVPILPTVEYEKISSFIDTTENQKQIPKGLLKAVIRQESSFNTRAYLGGSYGLGQITLGTARTYCNIHNIKPLYDYKTNISCAGEFLKNLLDRYNQRKYYALSAYNIGTPFVCNGRVYQRNLGRHRIETLSIRCKKRGKVSNEKYVTGVMRHWKEYKG